MKKDTLFDQNHYWTNSVIKYEHFKSRVAEKRKNDTRNNVL